MRLNRKAHAGAITDEWSEVEAQRFFSKLLCDDDVGEDNEKECRTANMRSDVRQSQSAASPLPMSMSDYSTETSRIGDPTYCPARSRDQVLVLSDCAEAIGNVDDQHKGIREFRSSAHI